MQHQLSLLLLLYPLALAVPMSTSISTPLLARQPPQCPLSLPPQGQYEFPHLIVPISKYSPDAAIGTTYSPSISPGDVSTIFNFDIPSERASQHCTLFFSFPKQEQLTTSSFNFYGPGVFTFSRYEFNTGAGPGTTWNSQPKVVQGGGNGVDSVTLAGVVPGTSWSVWNGDCGLVTNINGQKNGQGGLVSWRMSSENTCLWYFQDWNQCAIGLWLVYD